MQQLTAAMAALSGAAQVSVVTPDQLVPGALVTGTIWSSIRRIDRIEGDQIYTVKVHPVPPALPADHTHRYNTANNCMCTCGARRDLISVFMPAPTSGWIKSYLIVPQGTLLHTDPYSIYIGAGGVALTIGAPSAGWGRDVPVVPKLTRVWSVPEGLRALLAQ